MAIDQQQHSANDVTLPAMVPKPDDQYMFNRVHQDSARLVVQHWLWTHRLKYVLHPTIPTHNEHLRVADIGTANAVWITELGPLMPPTTRFDGFDISDDYFPAKELLSSNVSLHVLDALGDVPDDLVGQYDIVHIRAFVVIVRNNDPVRLLSNLIKLLSECWPFLSAISFKVDSVDQ